MSLRRLGDGLYWMLMLLNVAASVANLAAGVVYGRAGNWVFGVLCAVASALLWRARDYV